VPRLQERGYASADTRDDADAQDVGAHLEVKGRTQPVNLVVLHAQ
jgi:hypothetical protein